MDLNRKSRNPSPIYKADDGNVSEMEEEDNFEGSVYEQEEDADDLEGYIYEQEEDEDDLEGCFYEQEEDADDLEGHIYEQEEEEDADDLEGCLYEQEVEGKAARKRPRKINNYDGKCHDNQYETGRNEEEVVHRDGYECEEEYNEYQHEKGDSGSAERPYIQFHFNAFIYLFSLLFNEDGATSQSRRMDKVTCKHIRFDCDGVPTEVNESEVQCQDPVRSSSRRKRAKNATSINGGGKFPS